jgi:DHA3 family macrolide efflux protein-like MFS transporter
MTIEIPPLAVPPAPAAWKLRFFAIWSGQVCSLLGSQLVQFALIWYLTDRTGSATTLAIAALVGLLPQVFLSPFIGTWVDRWNRRLIMILADSAVALATAALALLFWLDSVAIWQIYLIMFVRAVGGGFHFSAMGASTVLLVPKAQLIRIQGLNQALRGGMDIFAAPLGALLLANYPLQAILAIDVTTACLAIVPLLALRIPQPQRDHAGGKPTFWRDFSDGFRYVLAWRGLMIVLIMAMLINFMLTPTVALLPLLVKQHLGGGAAQLAWLNATFAIGTIAGGLALGVWGGFRRRIVTALVGLIGIGLGTIVMGFTPANLLWPALLGMGIAGVMSPITNGSLGGVLQATIAPEMQGRVFAFVMSLASAISPLGLLLAGPLSDTLGILTWFILGGIVCAAMGVIGFAIPDVMNIEQQARHDEVVGPVVISGQ